MNQKFESFRIKAPLRSDYVYILLLGCFLAALLITNVITAKYFTIVGISLTAGSITYPFTFFFFFIIAEIFGHKRSQLAIWLGFFVSIFAVAVIKFAYMLPIYENSPITQTVFEKVYGFMPGIVLGSMVAYLIAQFTDVFIFELLKKLTRDKHLWLRNNVSTFISQLIDTLVFALVAWIIWPLLDPSNSTNPAPWPVWREITTNEYIFKIILSICQTPFIYGGVYLARKWMKETNAQ